MDVKELIDFTRLSFLFIKSRKGAMSIQLLITIIVVVAVVLIAAYLMWENYQKQTGISTGIPGLE